MGIRTQTSYMPCDYGTVPAGLEDARLAITCGNPVWKSLDGSRCACTVDTTTVPRRASEQRVFDRPNIRA